MMVMAVIVGMTMVMQAQNIRYTLLSSTQNEAVVRVDFGTYHTETVTVNGEEMIHDSSTDLFWQKKLGQYVSLAVQLRFYFGQGGYVGCQQLLHASVDLDKITFKHKK